MALVRSLTLAYRDVDRLPVIFAIREMAKRHCDLDLSVVMIKDEAEFKVALFNRGCDALVEHLEFLYEQAAKGKKITMFCAPYP
jgi:hypothetical protein